AGRNQDFTIGEVRKSAVVIHVQKGEDNFFHVSRSDAECAQSRTDLFVTINSKCDFPPNPRMIRLTGFEQIRSPAAVAHDDALPMLDPQAQVGAGPGARPASPRLRSSDCSPVPPF